MSSINKSYIQQLFDSICVEKFPSNFYFYFSGERSRFYRVNKSKLRQGTFVDQSKLTIWQKNENDENTFSIELIGDLKNDVELVKNALGDEFTQDVKIATTDECNIEENKTVNVEFLSTLIDSEDIVGILSEGSLQRGVIQGGTNNLKWFDCHRADIDYSIFRGDKCVKEFYSEKLISNEKLKNSLSENILKLNILSGERIELEPGLYPAYFSPSAVNEILSMFNWQGIQGKAFAEKQSVFMDLYAGARKLNKRFNLRENFKLNLSPIFNQEGEVSEEIIEIVKDGTLINPLVNSVTERKYGLKSNKADQYESLRSAELLAGTEPEKDLISKVRNGLYISNLHYLNWSSKKSASITGMTRYCCYFIDEDGEKHPIKDMRFNMSLYDLFGSWLQEFSSESQIFSDSNTYEQRHLGGAKVPGMLSSINLSL